MTLQLAQKIGSATIIRFLNQPSPGLVQIADNGHVFTVPYWLLEMAMESIIIDECQIKYCGETHCISEVRDEHDRWRKLCEAHVAQFQGTHRDGMGRRVAARRLKDFQ